MRASSPSSTLPLLPGDITIPTNPNTACAKSLRHALEELATILPSKPPLSTLQALKGLRPNSSTQLLDSENLRTLKAFNVLVISRSANGSTRYQGLWLYDVEPWW
jgi:hypothetical protein